MLALACSTCAAQPAVVLYRWVQAIDEEAAARGLTRSAFIASAALEKIRRGT
jgi:hypothetical protein